MATQTRRSDETRTPLWRARVVAAAIEQADAKGLRALSMRTLADSLGVAPMALYRHVANKEDLIDGMVDVLFGEIVLPAPGPDWRAAMQTRSHSLREVMAHHRWAIGLMESRRNPGPANLRHHDAVIGSLRAGGLDMHMAAHAYSVLDSYIYGFALTKMNLPFETADEIADVAQTVLEPFPVGEYPNLVAFISEVAMEPGYDYANEFEYGLHIVLDGIESLVARR